LVGADTYLGDLMKLADPNSLCFLQDVEEVAGMWMFVGSEECRRSVGCHGAGDGRHGGV
jgi:hypothetical protein